MYLRRANNSPMMAARSITTFSIRSMPIVSTPIINNIPSETVFFNVLSFSKNQNYHKYRKQKRVYQKRDDRHTADARNTRCHQKLCPVWNYTLHNTRTGIKKLRRLFGVHAILPADVFCNRRRDNDRDRIVGGCQIHERGKESHSEHSAPL